MSDIARLKVAIDEVAPPVIRQVEVPLAIRLDDLHFVLQIAIGWQNCHPYEFRSGDKAWGLIDRDASENPLPAEQATLADLAQRGRTFHYNYVFGDDWQHTVEIEDVVAAAPETAYPRLLSAEGRCPPADIGGPIGLRKLSACDRRSRALPSRGHAGMGRTRFRSKKGRFGSAQGQSC